MKVLFLDIDGVLNSDTTKERIGPDGGIFASFVGIDQKLLKLFQDWRKDKLLEIVLSSSWRTHDGLMNHLKTHGLEWIDITPNMGYRGKEVGQWVGGHNVDKYAILDDIQQFYPWQRPHFVKTLGKYGLREKDLRAVEVILGLE